jgi:hypothetical protein
MDGIINIKEGYLKQNGFVVHVKEKGAGNVIIREHCMKQVLRK